MGQDVCVEWSRFLLAVASSAALLGIAALGIAALGIAVALVVQARRRVRAQEEEAARAMSALGMRERPALRDPAGGTLRP